ncbi:RimK-like ATP-grasp domain-containing protein [Arthrobacter sp. ok909]|uniref:ATP-grasp domain-containing protein n=1 Tax=Arthrobacter sp. ok909 TaxID=1761746 RepID=UPI0008855CA5|nr:hypothetical protein [Arthrobacter sp. ok909]SDP78487.1 RimK-like ATP-grasp domain-containing protein [Arthrobacter sp. ok909]
MTRRVPGDAVLLWGIPTETTLSRVELSLRKLGAPVFVIDQRRIRDTALELESGAGIHGHLRFGPWFADLDTVRSFYMRPYDSRELPAVVNATNNKSLTDYALRTEELTSTWAEVTPALVVNRPSAMAANNSKPFQTAQAASIGFSVPETLVTTDPAAVKAFQNQHGEIVYKSISGVRSVVRTLTSEHDDRLHNVENCPTQFQRRIIGTNYRVHVVGSQAFACSITSKSTDYRYDSACRVEACILPRHIETMSINLTRKVGLEVSGLDLMKDLEGNWYCFEMNPSPGFTFFQDRSGQSVDAAIADLLASGRRSDSPPVTTDRALSPGQLAGQ